LEFDRRSAALREIEVTFSEGARAHSVLSWGAAKTASQAFIVEGLPQWKQSRLRKLLIINDYSSPS